MARKTKAELTAEREAALAAEREEERLSYPSRLMKALEEATKKNNYELTVKNGYFALRDRDERANYEFNFAYEYNSNTFFALEDLESDLRSKEAERAESQRLSELRRTAFLKLSMEEQAALGLSERNNW